MLAQFQNTRAVVFVRNVLLSGTYTTVVGDGGAQATSTTQAISTRMGVSTTFSSADAALNLSHKAAVLGAVRLTTEALMVGVGVRAQVKDLQVQICFCVTPQPWVKPLRKTLD